MTWYYLGKALSYVQNYVEGEYTKMTCNLTNGTVLFASSPNPITEVLLFFPFLQLNGFKWRFLSYQVLEFSFEPGSFYWKPMPCSLFHTINSSDNLEVIWDRVRFKCCAVLHWSGTWKRQMPLGVGKTELTTGISREIVSWGESNSQLL